MIRAKYEDLIIIPEKVLQGLCQWMDIDYYNGMVKGRGFKPPIYRVKQHALIGKEPDPNRTSGWERELTPRQVESFESKTGEFLTYLDMSQNMGYE